MSRDAQDNRPVAVLGAAGYVGSRLTARLLDQGRTVLALVRSPRKLAGMPFAGREGLRVVRADALDASSLRQAFRGAKAVFHLVHSMVAAGDRYAEADRIAARNVAEASAACGLDRIIYLGGLGSEEGGLSRHLDSRMEAGRIFMAGKTPATWLRAAQILGSGSASYEIIRYLVERLPVMVTPRWVDTECQPIAVSNVLDYLAGCLDAPETAGRSFDIGGLDILTYRQLFREYARAAGLRPRLIIPVPVLTPKLSSYWISLVTPVPARLARPLAAGVKHRVVCRENDIRLLIPARLLSVEEALRQAVEGLGKRSASDQCVLPGASPAEWPSCGDPGYSSADVKVCAFEVLLSGGLREAWEGLNMLGGDPCLYGFPWIWRARGWIDRRLGGPGLRMGRENPERFEPGDFVDFWRVESVEEGKRLRLKAEMRMPGQAVLEYALEPCPGGVLLRQTLRFAPRGLVGLLYWAALARAHELLFAGMLKRVAQATGRKLLAGPTLAAG